MPVNRKLIAAGVGAAAAAGAAIFGAVTLTRSVKEPTPQEEAEAFTVCLKADIAFVKDASKKCYAPAEAAALAEHPVLDDAGAPAIVALSSPNEGSRDVEEVGTCAQYRAFTRDGWYAASSAEMRREAFFQRACGVLDMVEQARAPQVSYFKDGELADADMSSLAETFEFRIGPAPAPPAPPTSVSAVSMGVWLFESGDQTARLQEIAHADFDGDGRGDMLVFVTVTVKDATATASLVGRLDKPSEDGPVLFVAK